MEREKASFGDEASTSAAAKHALHHYGKYSGKGYCLARPAAAAAAAALWRLAAFHEPRKDVVAAGVDQGDKLDRGRDDYSSRQDHFIITASALNKQIREHAQMAVCRSSKKHLLSPLPASLGPARQATRSIQGSNLSASAFLASSSGRDGSAPPYLCAASTALWTAATRPLAYQWLSRTGGRHGPIIIELKFILATGRLHGPGRSVNVSLQLLDSVLAAREARSSGT
ncbi:hypothetical protein HPB47_000940 [Ixodes persulcatus]|uniref:Uncharacterized protein n=1 Tax=Ixodes persulcatus TaxID=34615 RepID=A0AC60PQG7_IXOPE|nr:hypothetical protein HPB47_000940 [Ixodes persulcatus]